MSELFDFGSGPVPAHRHANGGGWVADDARVDAEVFLAPHSQIGSRSSASRLATIGDGVRIGNGVTIDEFSILGDGVWIGDDVWIGRFVCIGRDVRIGDGAIITEQEITGYTPNSPVPAVPQIDAAILGAIGNDESLLNMNDYHCGTSHCRAGWAIHLAGDAGYALERECSSWLAGALIYQASRPGQPLPYFFASNAYALADIRKGAANPEGKMEAPCK